jgi:acetyl esterase/lipase
VIVADVERNVIYGMYSGLALLMDIHRPAQPNGIGFLHISGSGWNAPLSLDARPLNRAAHVDIEAVPLVEAGYTAFSINHRATPRFHYPAAVEDAQRAVRFVRHHAADLGVDPERLGAVGGSSGGHLVCMLGVLAGEGEADSDSAVDGESASVQCVVARAPVVDFAAMDASSFLNVRRRADGDPSSQEHRIAREASPIHHVSPACPPFLLFHGDADQRVPFEPTQRFAEALRQAGVEVEFVPVPGADHGPELPGKPEDFRMVDHSRPWLDRHLLGSGR